MMIQFMYSFECKGCWTALENLAKKYEYIVASTTEELEERRTKYVVRSCSVSLYTARPQRQRFIGGK